MKVLIVKDIIFHSLFNGLKIIIKAGSMIYVDLSEKIGIIGIDKFDIADGEFMVMN